MAVPTGTFQAHSGIGIREDLADIVYDISPTDTPFMSNAQRGTCTATFHEWQTDVLATAAINSQIEGDDADTDTATATVRLGNYTNISRVVPRVTGTFRAVNTAGRADELSYQISKRARELKRNIETALLGTQAANAGGTGTARVCAGVAAFLWNNQVALGASATTPTVTSGAPTTAPTAGTTSTFVVADLKTCIANCWDDGGDPTLILVGSHNKQEASGFTGIATLYRDAQGNQPASILGSADIYVSDFGSHQIVADRFTSAGNVYVLDMEYWSVCYLRSIRQEQLSKTGDSDRRMILAEFTLEASNPASSGKVYSTTTS